MFFRQDTVELSYHEVERLIASLDEITESLTQHLANLENEASIRPLISSGPICLRFWRDPFLPIVRWWTLPLFHVGRPFVILGMPSLFCPNYSISDGKSCQQTMYM